MDANIATKIDAADIPAELRAALYGLAQSLDVLLPLLLYRPRRNIAFMFDELVNEATDETVDTHWWEVALDLIGKAAQEHDTVRQPVQAAIGQIAPLLRQRLGPYNEVSLREITEDTVVDICALSDTLTEPKKNFVAPNAISLAQAHFNKDAWFRAIYAGKAPVGFMMLVDAADEPEYFLWRFMIAQPYHGRGYGRQAIERLVDYVKTRPGAKELLVSCRQGEGSPEGFYLKLGFEPTGEIFKGEIVLRLPFEQR